MGGSHRYISAYQTIAYPGDVDFTIAWNIDNSGRIFGEWSSPGRLGPNGSTEGFFTYYQGTFEDLNAALDKFGNVASSGRFVISTYDALVPSHYNFQIPGGVAAVPYG